MGIEHKNALIFGDTMSEETEPNSFERFLIHHRPFCEVGTCMKPTVRIASPYKNPVAVCEKHWQEDQPIEQK
jgi:hypothetical protein